MFILCYAVHLAHLTHPGGKAVGYVDRLNWGHLYLTVFPLWLVFYAFLTGLMCYYPASKWRRFVRGKADELKTKYERLMIQLERDKHADEEPIA